MGSCLVAECSRSTFDLELPNTQGRKATRHGHFGKMLMALDSLSQGVRLSQVFLWTAGEAVRVVAWWGRVLLIEHQPGWLSAVVLPAGSS